MHFSVHLFSHLKLLSHTTIPLPMRLLTSDQDEKTLDVINATSNNGAAQNYFHGKFGKFVNIIKLHICIGGKMGS
jgi:hypothetical protein